MIFAYCDEASNETIKLKGELYKHLIKARRAVVNDEIVLKKLDDVESYYHYTIKSIEPRFAVLVLQRCSTCSTKTSSTSLHVGWCQIDPKSVESVLGSLNELGVDKITFITCERSQKNFKIQKSRLEKILINSNQQCGRDTFMKFDYASSLLSFIENNPDSTLFDFSENVCNDFSGIKTFIVGCEGGFTQNERNFLKQLKVYKLDTKTVLRSQSAVLGICSKILL
ncbi:MAG: RsmE family RNA methyltransferase [Campylobacterota bacterium]|nr:RsmE family RNA methyltransferase [Campylobacterota bacterium]